MTIYFLIFFVADILTVAVLVRFLQKSAKAQKRVLEDRRRIHRRLWEREIERVCWN